MYSFHKFGVRLNYKRPKRKEIKKKKKANLAKIVSLEYM